jgi:pimeloyl-ACP methyl ester carboxylesterase
VKESFTTGDGRTLSYARTGTRPDFFGPPANADMVELVPDARSVVLADAGHFVWFDAPDRLREEVTRFLLG